MTFVVLESPKQALKEHQLKIADSIDTIWSTTITYLIDLYEKDLPEIYGKKSQEILFKITVVKNYIEKIFCSWIKDDVLYLCKNPTVIKIDSDVLHCENGPAICWPDGYSFWRIQNYIVDEKIVMNPQSQTLKEIDSEKNQDIKAIRIERYGWPQYIKDSGAELIHFNEDFVAGTIEQLYKLSSGELRLVVNCPTGKIPCLPVPNNITTCQEAQKWLDPLPTKGSYLFRT